MNGTIKKASGANAEGPLHVDGYLTSYSEAYAQEESAFVSGVAASNIPVTKQSDLFVKYPRGYFWRDQVARRPLGGRPVQASYKVSSDTYIAEEWALEHVIDDRQRANTDQPINLEENATMLLTQAQMIRSDRLWAQSFFTTGVWTSDFIGGADFMQFSDPNSDPLREIEEKSVLMQSSAARRPNTLIAGANVNTEFVNHPDIIDRIKYTQRGVVTADILAAMFGVQNYRVAASVYNSAKEGATDDVDFIVDPDSFWLGYIAPQAALNTPTAIGRFAWTGLVPGATNSLGGVISRGRDGRAYSDYFHSRTAFALKAVSVDLGIFFSHAVSPPSN